MLGFGLFAAPVVVNVLRNPGYGQPLPVDYTIFLRQFWPLHFLFDANSMAAKLGLLVVVAGGALALAALGRRARPYQLAFVGYLVVYGIGIAVPSLTHNPGILNLHLLRSSTLLHMVASLAIVALATRWLVDTVPANAMVFGPLLALTACSGRPLLVLAAAVILAQRAVTALDRPARITSFSRRVGPIIRFGSALLLVAAFGYNLRSVATVNAGFRRQESDWAAVGTWARANTPVDAQFMVPTVDIRPGAAPPRYFAGDSAVFQYYAHRRIWVDFANGAAVLWSPTYYSEWNSRIWAVLGQEDLQGRLDYARKNAVDYVVDLCEHGAGRASVFQTDGICVYDARG